MSRPIADVIIVTWNGRDDTLRAVETTLAQIGSGPGQVPGAVVTVVDNGSTDGTWEALLRLGPKVRCIRLLANRGFTGGIAAGVAASTAENLVFLNNDAFPEDGWLAGMVDGITSAAADVIACAGKIIDYQGRLVDFVDGVITFDGHAFQRGFRRPLGEVSEPVAGSEMLFACGGNMIVRREPYLTLGGFDDDYFAYLEDVDFGWRSWIAGWRVLWEPRGVVRHKSSATSNRIGNFERGVLFERNAIQTAFKNYDDEIFAAAFSPVLLTLLHRLHRYVVDRNRNVSVLRRPAFGHAEAGDGPSPGLWQRLLERLGMRTTAPVLDDPLTVMQFRATDWFFRNQHMLSNKRASVQATRKRSDREIFAKFPLHIVPTYHGDADLFGSALFAAIRPVLPTTRCSIQDLMNTGA